jgi:O-antigen ligase
MTYLIFFTSLIAVFIFTRPKSTRELLNCIKTKPGPAILLIILFAVTFLGDFTGESEMMATRQLAIPSGVRMARFIMVVGIFLIVFIRLLGRSSAFRQAGMAAKFMLFYAILALASAIYSIHAIVTLWKGFELFVFVLAGIYLASELKRWEDLRWLNNMLMLVMLFLVVSALTGVVLAPGEAFKKLELSSSIVIRGLAPPINANSLTQFSALLMVMALASALDAEKNHSRMGIWVIVGLATTAMLLSHSRTSLFAGILAAGAVLYFGGRKTIAFLAAAGGMAAYTMTDIVMDYVLRGQSEEVFTSLTGRTYFWKSAWGVFLESPFIGKGFYAAHRSLMNVSSVDNTYLAVLLGNGIIGLIIFIVPIIIVAMQLLLTIPNKTHPKAEKILWLQLMVLFVLLIVRSTTGPSFQSLHANLVMFMMLLIGAQAYRRLRRRPVDTKNNLNKNIRPVQKRQTHLPQRKSGKLAEPSRGNA